MKTTEKQRKALVTGAWRDLAPNVLDRVVADLFDDLDEIIGFRDAYKRRADEAEQELAAVTRERDEARTVMQIIAKLMGRVCDEYETCHHQACADSCGAALLCINVLNGEAIPNEYTAALAAARNGADK